jgi:hypothetical protein
MNENKLLPNKEAIQKHLEFLFSNINEYQDGQIEIAYTPAHSGAVNKAQYFDATDIEGATDFAYTINSNEGLNVYVGAALRSPDCSPIGRSSLDDYYVSTCAWADLDDAGVVEQSKDLYKDCPPSLVVVTGRHPHVRSQYWWKLGEPIDNHSTLKETLSKLCASLNGDKAVVDPARVMRIGGSIAWPKKDGRIPELTEVHIPKDNTKHVAIERLNEHFPCIDAPLTQTSIAGGVTVYNDGKPRNILTDRIDIRALLEQSRIQGKWHYSMRDAVAHMVSSNYTDQQIRLTCAAYCDNGYDDTDLTPLIDSARKKWNIPQEQSITIAVNETNEVINQETGEVIEAQSFPLLYADEITPNFDSRDFIEDLLSEEQFSVIYGESNCGKTFFMLDLAMHVAIGRKWRDKEVEGGGVIYAALEGAMGTKNRIASFKKFYNITQPINLAVIPSNINFIDSAKDMPALVQTIKEAQARIGNVKLIVIDTLARAMGGSDENSGQDMGTLIRNADMIREITKAHIAFVHHSGKDTAKGARGHSSLRAAVDTEIEISRKDKDSPSLIKIAKQREIEMIEDMAFKLEVVELGENRRGKAVTSCVVAACDVVAERDDTRLTAVQQFIYDAILDAMIRFGADRRVLKDQDPLKTITYDDMHMVLTERGYKDFLDTETSSGSEKMKNHTTNARVALNKKGKIASSDKYIWLIGKD